MDTDEILVRGAKLGDAGCFGQLMELHGPKAFATAVAILAHRQDAEEVVQDAALDAFMSIRKLKGNGAFETWFSRIVVNRAIDRLRRRWREQRRIVPLADLDLPSGVQDNDAVMDVMNAVARLPEEHQAIIRLYYFEGHSTAVVAQLMGKPEGTVRRRLSESYRLLRGILQ